MVVFYFCKNTKDQWYEWEDIEEIYPNFQWPENVDYVWTADWIVEPIIDPGNYDEEGVRGLINVLMLSYKIEDVDTDEEDD